jgi:hypothetical protein
MNTYLDRKFDVDIVVINLHLIQQLVQLNQRKQVRLHLGMNTKIIAVQIKLCEE